MDYELTEKGFVQELKELTAPVVLSCQSIAPYSGCWEEPNHWLLKDGQLYPLYVSGVLYAVLGYEGLAAHDVIMKATPLQEFIEQALAHQSRYSEWRWAGTGEVDLGENYHNIVTVILDRHNVPTPKWVCDTCGDTYQGVAHFLGYRGNGGIGIFLRDYCCGDCLGSSEYCSVCDHKTEAGWCEHCEDDVRTYGSEDQAPRFGLDGSQFLGPGESQGPPPVIVIAVRE